MEQARWILSLNSAYTGAKILHSAVEVGLFEFLADGGSTLDGIVDGLELHRGTALDFLDALAGLGLLTREDGAYRNSAAAEEFLVPSRPLYLGGSVLSHSEVHYGAWAGLTSALRDGRANSGVVAAGFTLAYDEPERLRKFLEHMDSFNRFVADGLDTCVDWKDHGTFLDLGGARGNIAAHLVRTHRHLRGTVFDLAPVEAHFDEHMAAMGTADRVGFHSGDFFTDPIPRADVVIIGHTLHDWGEEQRRRIVERAAEAVSPGGALVVYDAMIDDDRADPDALLQSLRCRMVREGGSEYTVEQCRSWVESAGLSVAGVHAVDSLTRDKVLIAGKPE